MKKKHILDQQTFHHLNISVISGGLESFCFTYFVPWFPIQLICHYVHVAYSMN